MSLGAALETLYGSTDFTARIQRDPVRAAHRYADPLDQELAGLVSALFAYGRVDLFGPVVDEVLRRMGPSPRAFVDRFTDTGQFADIVYRWNRGPDVVQLCQGLQGVLAKHGSLGALARPRGRDTIEVLVAALHEEAARVAGLEPSAMPRGFRSWMTRPSKGSACKRWAMYVRWMVRSDREGVDLGIWDAPASGLTIPVDVHVLRISRFIGLTERGDGSWRTAEAITARLREFDPDDPVRFDFALAHLGISGLCVGHKRAQCSACPLEPYCSASWKPKT